MTPLMLALLLSATVVLTIGGESAVHGGVATMRRAWRVAGVLLLAALVMGAAALG